MSKYVKGVNEENMDKFLAALRSGEYKQTDGKLHDAQTGGYCCLGVASEVAHVATDGVVSKKVTVVNPEYSMVFYDNQRLLAPESVIDWLGIPTENRELNALGETDGGSNIMFFKPELYSQYSDHTTATELNDDMGMSFQEIADVFEAEFKREDV